MSKIEEIKEEQRLNEVKEANKKIAKLFKKTKELEIGEYQKSAKTLGRIPSDFEIGRELHTFVLNKDGAPVREATNIISEDVVIARNPEELYSYITGGYINEHRETYYNEWLVPKETWIKNYGRLPESKEAFDHYKEFSSEFVAAGMAQPNSIFEPMKKIAKIQAIEVTDEIYKELQKTLKQEGNFLLLPVEWSKEPMKFEKGDFITNQGYSINRAEMEKTYEKVQDLGVKPIIPKIEDEKPTPGQK